jgi:hypothetical protein
MIRPSVERLWLEYRVASQFPRTWDWVEQNIETARRKEGLGAPLDDDEPSMPVAASGGSAAYWMSQVEVPGWFKRDELGLGTATSIMETMRGLAGGDNERRKEAYRKRIEELKKYAAVHRQVVSRKVMT